MSAPRRIDCGESLNEFVARIESLSDSQRLRVPATAIDEKGNVILTPVILTHATDIDGTPHEIMRADGQTKHYQWPAGHFQRVTGTFTKTTAGGTGYVDIEPGTDDEIILMYGHIICDATPGAVPAAIEVFHSNAAGSSGARHDRILLSDPWGASETYSFPTHPQAAAVATGNMSSHETDLSRLVANGTYLKISWGGMDNGDTCVIHVGFRSLLNVAPVVTATGGTFA